MKQIAAAVLASVMGYAPSAYCTDSSPAMETVMAVKQSEFRGYKPGNKEMLGKLRELGKEADADEMEQVMKGEKADWVIVDIRDQTQYKGGHVEMNGRKMLNVGRLKPTSIMEKELMEVKNGKEIVKTAPKNIIIMCRSGMKSAFDYASYAVAGFNDVKVAGVATWAKACKPLVSETKIEDAGLLKKKLVMKQHTDGNYYWDQCPVFEQQ